ncbi:MAG TPA: hypothetical protein VJI68_01225 [Candidatus Nanoarchaeia archaeon]|nr:hypothetical protein [Candidatus Nanoarchaeia archaeon]
MPKEESIITGAKVKFKGVFELEIVYQKLRQWIVDEEYTDPCVGGEIKYAEKIKPNGKQVEIIWQSSKKENDGFILKKLEIVYLILGLTEVEVEVEGQKVNKHKAEIEMHFNSSIIENANKSWDENTLMYKIYRKMVLFDNIEQAKIDSYKDTMNVMDEVKNLLNLHRF